MTRAPLPLAPILLALAVGSACATSGDSLSGKAAAPAEGQTEDKRDDKWAERTLARLEQRLLEAEAVELGFEIQSSGAVASQFSGTLAWAAGGEMTLLAKGEFDGEARELELRADAEQLRVLVAGEVRHEGPRPAALVEAVVLSLTRQGLLHNLALLSAGLPPEHGEGGIDEWLRFAEPQLGPPEVFGAGEAEPLEFQIEVEGQHVGHVSAPGRWGSSSRWGVSAETDREGLPGEIMHSCNGVSVLIAVGLPDG